jgi:hypothetical protein
MLANMKQIGNTHVPIIYILTYSFRYTHVLLSQLFIYVSPRIMAPPTTPKQLKAHQSSPIISNLLLAVEINLPRKFQIPKSVLLHGCHGWGECSLGRPFPKVDRP